MESFETVSGGPVGDETAPVPPDAPDVGSAASSAPKRHSAHVQSTRGGSGAAAGATPKKAHRPSRSERHRPAGKKPDRKH